MNGRARPPASAEATARQAGHLVRMLRVGCVKYLNARPLIRGWPGEVHFDHPSALCKRLANGELDVALVSSFEFLRNPIYQIVDDVSISSDGPVYSVLVAHHGNISRIKEIELDPASQTGVNLLRCLFKELELNPQLIERSTGILPVGPAGVSRAIERSGSRHRARLLIGDQAIRFRQEHNSDFHFWDLGEQWTKLTALPFVYALWLIRPEVVDTKTIANRLRILRGENLATLDDVVAEVVAGLGNSEIRGRLNRKFLLRYYRDYLRFGFGEKEKQGLQTFRSLCARHGLLPKRELLFDLV